MAEETAENATVGVTAASTLTTYFADEALAIDMGRDIDLVFLRNNVQPISKTVIFSDGNESQSFQLDSSLVAEARVRMGPLTCLFMAMTCIDRLAKKDLLHLDAIIDHINVLKKSSEG